jgi:hypothetical protein
MSHQTMIKVDICLKCSCLTDLCGLHVSTFCTYAMFFGIYVDSFLPAPQHQLNIFTTGYFSILNLLEPFLQ